MPVSQVREDEVTLVPGHLPEEQQKILRAVALAYRRVMRSPREPASTRGEIARRDQKRQSEALAAATAEYRPPPVVM